MRYTILRYDLQCPAFGYVVSQHHTLRTARAAYRPYRMSATHLLYRMDGFIAKGSTIDVREAQVVHIDAR